jgi:CxxC motif-containing protein (DUF1111 family)
MPRASLLAALCAVLPFAAIWLISPAQASSAKANAPTAKTLGDPIPNLSRPQLDEFTLGRRLFRWELWRPSPGAKGFNSRLCSSCHDQPEVGGGSIDAVHQVGFKADPSDPSGFTVVHRLRRTPDGRFAAARFTDDVTVRRAPMLVGIGLLEAVPDATLKKLADPNDANKDGISGRSLMVGGKPGKFGWKGNIATIDEFTVTAFRVEMGLVSEPTPQEDFGSRLGPNHLRAVAHYMRALGAPPKLSLNAQASKGKALFQKLACGSCHTPQLKTGASALSQLSNKTFEPYTDLLLHEMSDKGSLKKSSGAPTPTEIRTAPLWGIGSFAGPYMHDASAKTLEEAILKHAGEAKASASKFKALPASDKAALLAFLKRL